MTKQIERRLPCPLHKDFVQSLQDGDDRMKRIDENIDMIMKRKLTYIDQQNILAQDMTRVKAIVENGLQKNVQQLAAAAVEVNQKVQLLNDFAWFIELVNDFRAGLVKRCLKYAFWGGVIALAYTALIAFGNDVFPKLAAKVF